MEENLMPQVFAHEEFGKVRVVMKDGAPWFVAADVCRILEIDKTQTRRLDDDEKGLYLIHTQGGEQSMLIVNEPGLYRLIFTSRKPEAKKFQRWVYHEVLPSIRKTGSYSVANVNPLAHAISELAAVEREKFNVENSEETKLFKRAQLLRDIASSSKDDFLRDKLLHEATKILMGNDFFKEITDDDNEFIAI
ncbi:MAG: Bro-N domain-containing protein [Selenomonadaceae bacterium]|nr:Bro-N domain-containing protein [Selenomonadaceae bacterium]